MKKQVKRLLAFIPSPLPFGAAEFETWASDIIYTYDLPDNDSFRWSLATMIQHCGATEATKPKRYFGRCARKGAANQVANWVMVELKEKQKAAEAAAKAEAEKEQQGAATSEHEGSEIQSPKT